MEKAKKSLGQNFLINKDKIKKIIGVLNMKANDTIIEIGPGHGEITNELVSRIQSAGWRIESRIIAIEKDERLAEKLKREFKGNKNVEIIAGDVLKILPNITSIYNLQPTTYKLIGNIPYYITGFLLRTIGELKIKPEITVLTIQKEVAERICGGMNLLAASIQYWAEVEIAGIIPKKDFFPVPKVDSAIIRLVSRSQNLESRKTKEYYEFIRILFKQPRKTILNNLIKTGRDKTKIEEILKENNIKPSERAQNLNISQIKELAQAFAA